MIFRVLTNQARWEIKPPFDRIFIQEYLNQKLLESDNHC